MTQSHLQAANNNAKTSAVFHGRTLQKKCACEEKQNEDDRKLNGTLQKKVFTQTNTAQQNIAPKNTENNTPIGNGQPLPVSLKTQYRKNFGGIIDQVRIYNDASSNNLVTQHHAAAITSGTDIYFANGMFNTGSSAGKKLIAHELAHVHQQHRPNGPPTGYHSRPNDQYEQEADRFADTGYLSASELAGKPTANSIKQKRTTAEQIASIIRSAVEGLGTDEEAIFNALTARTPAEINDIKLAYSALANGESLEDRLHDELSGKDLSKALSLLHGETAATETARRLWDAMRGWGTDEEAIYAAVAGRTLALWQEIEQAFQDMTGNVLLTELRDELNNSEWQYLQTLLPGAAGGAVTAQDRATVIANRLEAAMAGWGTDEDAIYAALTGHSDAELREIEKRFKLLTGFDLDTRLRDELNDSEYSRAQRLLHPELNAVRLARRIRDAVTGPGTDELEIQAILSGRTEIELLLIKGAYRSLYDESLDARLNEELSGTEHTVIDTLSQDGILQLEDEIKLAVAGLGTDEERLMAVFAEINAAPNPGTKLQDVINAYAAKGYGNMLDDIDSDLTSREFKDALSLLLSHVQTGSCNSQQTNEGLKTIARAAALAHNSVSELDDDINAGTLSKKVSRALQGNFNPGRAANAVNLALARQVRDILNTTHTDLLTRGSVTCTTPNPLPCGTVDVCAAKPDCERGFTYAWTCPAAGSLVRLCPAFFLLWFR